MTNRPPSTNISARTAVLALAIVTSYGGGIALAADSQRASNGGYSARALVSAAEANLAAGHTGRAILEYERATLAAPRSPAVLAGLARARAAANLPPDAPSLPERALRMAGADVWGWVGMSGLILAAMAVVAAAWGLLRRRGFLFLGAVAAGVASLGLLAAMRCRHHRIAPWSSARMSWRASPRLPRRRRPSPCEKGARSPSTAHTRAIRWWRRQTVEAGCRARRWRRFFLRRRIALEASSRPCCDTEMRLLLVEDDQKIAVFVEKGLRQEGHAVDWVRTGTEGVAGLLDPDALRCRHRGRDASRARRPAADSCGSSKASVTPIIVLSARDAVIDRIAGLEAGADDYLTKPFSFAERSLE